MTININENDLNFNMLKGFQPTSIAFQVTEQCTYGCKFCLRRVSGEEPVTVSKAKKIIDSIDRRGIKRLTFTGGEPFFLGKGKLFQLIKYANFKGIHTCLSTRGLCLSRNDIIKLENFLDHLLISLHCIRNETAVKLYYSYDLWKKIFRKTGKILNWTKNSEIITEVSTVVNQENINETISIGNWIYSHNANALWRVEEYYYNGIQIPNQRDKFEISRYKFQKLIYDLKNLDRLEEKVRNNSLRFTSKECRKLAKDVMVTPKGNIVTRSNNKYELKGNYKILQSYPVENRLPWKDYKKYCRKDWE